MPRGIWRAANPQARWGERDARMDWLKKLGKDRRGSRPRCVLLTDGSPEEVAGRLTQIICRPEVEVSPGDQWQPQGTSDVCEAELDKALKRGAVLLSEAIRGDLRKWWLAQGGNRSRTPNWDIASTCTVSGRKGLLLVEAKAHSNEVLKRNRCGAKPANRKRIEDALEEANTGLRELTGGRWRLSAEDHYQLSNRFAWSWKLARFGVPVVLLYLGFRNAVEMADKEIPFGSDDDWRDTLLDHCSGVIDAACWERALDVGGTPLLPMMRTVEQPFELH